MGRVDDGSIDNVQLFDHERAQFGVRLILPPDAAASAAAAAAADVRHGACPSGPRSAEIFRKGNDGAREPRLLGFVFGYLFIYMTGEDRKRVPTRNRVKLAATSGCLSSAKKKKKRKKKSGYHRRLLFFFIFIFICDLTNSLILANQLYKMVGDALSPCLVLKNFCFGIL